MASIEMPRSLKGCILSEMYITFNSIWPSFGAKEAGRRLRSTSPLGISVHDHIIVGKNGHASLKGMRLI
jgi:hypothetical protein